MANAVIGYQNKALAAALSGGGAVATLPVQNLVDDQPRKYYRTTGNAAFLVADLGAGPPATDAVAIPYSNLSAAATKRLRLSSADATGAAGDVFDSGVVAGALNLDGGVLFLLAASLTARYVRVDLADAAPVTPAGGGGPYIDLGHLFIGPLFKPGRNFAYGAGIGVADLGSVTLAPGGQAHAKKGARLLSQSASFEWATEAEAMTGFLDLDRTIGSTDAVLFVRDSASAYLAQGWFWAMPQKTSELQNRAFRLWRRSYSFLQRK